jgi:hypothetical protein
MRLIDVIRQRDAARDRDTKRALLMYRAIQVLTDAGPEAGNHVLCALRILRGEAGE